MLNSNNDDENHLFFQMLLHPNQGLWKTWIRDTASARAYCILQSSWRGSQVSEVPYITCTAISILFVIGVLKRSFQICCIKRDIGIWCFPSWKAFISDESITARGDRAN
mmetsp:Transcript_35168/g.48954  ORF Transcript_35168/g.48954 Transcript_35168/m.48954 type:complete len:109 (-) Transcript_35168:1174-1500(-)